MAKANNSKGESEALLGAGVMGQFEDSGLGHLNRVGVHWLEAIADINSEIASFVASRIKEDAQTQRALMQCKTTEDLQKEQFAFLERAYAQYTAETGKVIEMGLDSYPSTRGGSKSTPL